MPRSAVVLNTPPPRSGAAEQARLRALARYVVLDSLPESQFDDITTLAATVTASPIAAIGFVDEGRVWLKSVRGLARTDVPRDCSFCSDGFGLGPVLISDAATDERCAAVRWVQDQPNVRFYAAEPLLTPDGFTVGHLMVMDTTPRQLGQAERAALAALARQVMVLLELRRTLVGYHTAIDSAGLVVFHCDPSGRLISVTPTWAKLTGHGVVRSLGKPLDSLMHPDDAAVVRTRLEQVASEQKPVRLDCRVATASGTDLHVELFAQPLQTHGMNVGLIGIIADISERRAREIEDQHRLKLESLGRLAAGVAHEINTPIQFVGDNTRYLGDVYDLMLRTIEDYQAVLSSEEQSAEKLEALARVGEDLDLDEITREVPSAIEETIGGVERIATIVRAMKGMSHPGLDYAAPADINEAVRATVAIARNELKYDADIVLDLAPLPPVTCFIADLNQVLLNLLVNAADAVRESGEYGKITITTRQDNDDALIHIADTGIGMAPELTRRIFEPFFTTKPLGHGTGQGLALAHVVVHDKHGGVITVDSAVGKGSTFTIRIPINGRRETESHRR